MQPSCRCQHFCCTHRYSSSGTCWAVVMCPSAISGNGIMPLLWSWPICEALHSAWHAASSCLSCKAITSSSPLVPGSPRCCNCKPGTAHRDCVPCILLPCSGNQAFSPYRPSFSVQQLGGLHLRQRLSSSSTIATAAGILELWVQVLSGQPLPPAIGCCCRQYSLG